ncbi:MAG: AzlD domain-containing protein [Paracoccaceae bacterium]
MSEPLAWLAVAMMAATLFALRYAGFAIMRYVRITPKIELFLEKMSVSVLVAIVASSLVTGGFRTAAAVAFGVATMLATKSPVAAMLVGIGIGAAWVGFTGV